MRRVVVVGTCGSGKTTFASRLAALLAVPHLELDALYWGENWTEPPQEVFLARLEAALGSEAWVVDGNYGAARALIWPQAEVLVWLDYPFRLTFSRLVRRTLGRVLGRKVLWAGNRETWANVLGKDSILWFAIRTYGDRRRKHEQMLASGDFPHLQVFRFRDPQEAEAFLASHAELQAA